MTGWIILPIFAIFGIIGYRLAGLIGSAIDRYTVFGDKPEREKGTN